MSDNEAWSHMNTVQPPDSSGPVLGDTRSAAEGRYSGGLGKESCVDELVEDILPGVETGLL